MFNGRLYLFTRRFDKEGDKVMGKGSSPRPIPNRKQYEDNWDKIFGKKDANEPKHTDKKKTD